MKVEVSVVGASGYAGGEALRLLLGHPQVKIGHLYSRSYPGKYVQSVHPNLRGLLDKQFTAEDPVKVADASDVTFFAMPHGQSSRLMKKVIRTRTKVVDLGADFRLKDPKDYPTWYHYEHPYPELLAKFVYGLPELHRKELSGASNVAVGGCIACSSILSLAPAAKEGLLDGPVIVDAKVGSSGSGGKPSMSTHFSERYGVVRIYKPMGHRHTAEVVQELGGLTKKRLDFAMSAHGVNMVRGILTTAHARTKSKPSVKDLWRMYRSFYQDSFFVRIVRDLAGMNRYPDPKFTVGSNFADVGFEFDDKGSRLIALGALDNLVKGAAGNAVQCMNLMLGFDESEGLGAPPLHPV